MKKLGQALHTAQDRGSHASQGIGFFNHWYGSQPDNKYKHTKEYIDSFDRTESILDSFGKFTDVVDAIEDKKLKGS